MSFKQLRAFNAVAEFGSFTEAARRLNVSQSTVTLQVRELEARYNVELFHRHGRITSLTDFGGALFTITRRLILAQSEAEAFLQASKVLETGKLRLAAVGPFHAAEIASAFGELGKDDAIKGIVFTSSDGALAGADILELAALKDADACRGICLKTHPIMETIEALPKPVVAALNGPVLGGGAEFSMACHARVAGKGLMVGQPEVNLGIIPGYGGTQRLPRLVGLPLATAMLRTAKTINAKEACENGWAHGSPVADPMATAKELIGQHLEGKVTLSPVDPSPMKDVTIPAADIGHRSLAIDAILVDVMKQGLQKPLSEGLRIEADGFGRCYETVDMNVGMTNFIQNGPRVPALFLHE